MAKVTFRKAEVDGFNIFYREAGPKRAQTLLLLHGFPSAGHMFRDTENVLIPVEGQTFCPYKGLASYYDIGDHKKAAWSYTQAWREVARVSNLVSFEPDEIEVFLDAKRLALEPGQSVMPHGIDRGLDPDEILEQGKGPARP